MMDLFLKLPVFKTDEGGKPKEGLEDVRINMRYVTDYRPWMHEDKELTGIFFDKRCKKPKLLSPVSCEAIDEAVSCEEVK